MRQEPTTDSKKLEEYIAKRQDFQLKYKKGLFNEEELFKKEEKLKQDYTLFVNQADHYFFKTLIGVYGKLNDFGFPDDAIFQGIGHEEEHVDKAKELGLGILGYELWLAKGKEKTEYAFSLGVVFKSQKISLSELSTVAHAPKNPSICDRLV